MLFNDFAMLFVLAMKILGTRPKTLSLYAGSFARVYVVKENKSTH